MALKLRVRSTATATASRSSKPSAGAPSCRSSSAASSRYVPAVYEHGTRRPVLLHRDGVPRGAKPVRGDRRGPLPAARAVHIASQICEFLEAADTFDRHARRAHASLAPARRPQAAEHPRPGRRRDQGVRLRHREGAVAQPQGHAQRLRQHRLPVARAARVGRHRRPGRLLGGRRAALRDGERRAAVPGRGHAAGWSSGFARAGRRPRSTATCPIGLQAIVAEAARAGASPTATATRPRFATICSRFAVRGAGPGRARRLARAGARRSGDAADASCGRGRLARATPRSHGGPCGMRGDSPAPPAAAAPSPTAVTGPALAAASCTRGDGGGRHCSGGDDRGRRQSRAPLPPPAMAGAQGPAGHCHRHGAERDSDLLHRRCPGAERARRRSPA